jgi:hypothetical protein
MNADDPRTQLRGAVHRGDAAVIIALLQRTESLECLQLGGDGLLIALDQGTDGAVELARQWVVLLRERWWEGDTELADQLAARLQIGPTPMLRPLPIDLDQLSGILEGDPVIGGGRVDLRSGEVWSQPVLEDAVETGDEDEDGDFEGPWWLTVECEGSRAGYRDMQDFIAAVPDEDRRDRLAIAIEGRGAFRRFKDVLSRWPEEFGRWYAFSEERQRGRARAWLTDAGYYVAPRTARSPH